ANEPTRPVEGRLTGGFKYAPPPAATRGRGDRESSPDIRIATAKIERAESDRSSAENRAALATASVALGRYDRAIELLETALADRPDNARWLSDLSAAYLASFKASGRTDNVPKALDSAGRAFRIDPSLRE